MCSHFRLLGKIKCTRTLEFRLFLRTHLSYRKNWRRTHSTPVSTMKLLFVLTSDVLTLDHAEASVMHSLLITQRLKCTHFHIVSTSTSAYQVSWLKLGSGVGWRSDNCHFGGVRGGSPAKKNIGLRLCGTHFLSLQ